MDGDAIEAVITGYTCEAGVRHLEWELGKVTRKVTTEFTTAMWQPPMARTSDDVPESVRDAMTFHLANRVGDVLSRSNEAPPQTDEL